MKGNNGMTTINFASVANTTGPGLPKADLVGALVAGKLSAFDPEIPGKFGPTAQADLAFIVVVDDNAVSQDLAPAGASAHDVRYFGLFAKQLGAVPVGQMFAARVVSGQRGSTTWIGLDFALGADETDAAAAAVSNYLSRSQQPQF